MLWHFPHLLGLDSVCPKNLANFPTNFPQDFPPQNTWNHWRVCVGAEGELVREEFSLFGDRYDWTTGGPYDGNEWKKYRVVPHAHPRVPFFMLILIGLQATGLLAFQERGGIASFVRWNLRPVIFGVEPMSWEPGLSSKKNCWNNFEGVSGQAVPTG